ncbi:hypothetical protein Tco_0388439, partial [Tanacetum coccineum]
MNKEDENPDDMIVVEDDSDIDTYEVITMHDDLSEDHVIIIEEIEDETTERLRKITI